MRPLIIAHRGASGYLPEHTLEAKRLAHEMRADYLEQDVVAASDDELVVLHDVHLDRVTDVAERFPGRSRKDGRFYVRDFDLAELRRLRVRDRRNADGSAVYPTRPPVPGGDYRLHTLREELAFIGQLNAESEHVAGIYTEIKRPAWHREQGIDLSPRVLEALQTAGYDRRGHRAYLQCFDATELRRIRHELGSDLKLVQLVGENDWHESTTDFDLLRSRRGLRELAGTVDAVGPWLEQLYQRPGDDAAPEMTGLTAVAHDLGLAVHPYTFRLDDLPDGFGDFASLVHYFAGVLCVDGLFTDFPDRVRSLILP